MNTTSPSPAMQTIALVKEIESPENPGGLEKRVALVPEDVGLLVARGLSVFVERGAGEGVGFSDDEYLQYGVTLQSADEIYRDKDLVIKFKGPSMASIEQMKPGCTLLCMAHFHSYPDRAERLQAQRINVIAMEEILESPKVQSDLEIVGRTAMAQALAPFIESGAIRDLHLRVLDWNPGLRYGIRRAGNRSPASLKVLQPDVEFDALDTVGENSLYFYDSQSLGNRQALLEQLSASGAQLFDLHDYTRQHGAKAIADYRSSHPPLDFGLRRIQCLHETGRAGARYGLQLLKESRPELATRDINAVVLGYGNVGQGAIHEIHSQGVGQLAVLGREQTAKGMIEPWLEKADLIVNGAEQAIELRGKNFLVSNDHLANQVRDGSVVIDLVGGSPTNRSPVEAVLSCTFLTDPHFVQQGVTISSLWGWPMMGMMRETAIKYSGQIREVLIDRERLVNGLDHLAPGVSRALVCGPFAG